jgi:hypothetical protein
MNQLRNFEQLVWVHFLLVRVFFPTVDKRRIKWRRRGRGRWGYRTDRKRHKQGSSPQKSASDADDRHKGKTPEKQKTKNKNTQIQTQTSANGFHLHQCLLFSSSVPLFPQLHQQEEKRHRAKIFAESLLQIMLLRPPLPLSAPQPPNILQRMVVFVQNQQSQSLV